MKTSLNLNAINVRIERCRACQSQIFFAKTPNDKSVPLDVVPIDTGTYVIDHDDPLTLAKFVAGEHDGRARYESHFKTCTEPGRFSKRRKGNR